MITPEASPPRPLPIRPRPMSGENPDSYLRRLARANHLRPGYLRRYLRQPGGEEAIRLDWLAILADRPLPVIERVLDGQASGPGPARRHTRQAEKPRLFAAIRRDARDSGLSVRALADRHGVHRRTVRQALASPWPEPRKNYERRSKLDPFKDAIDTMLSAPDTAEQAPLTARRVHDRLASEHGMTGVSYSTVRDYLSGRLPIQPPAARRPGSSGDDARRAVTHLRELLEAVRPGTAAKARPHLDAVVLVITQAVDAAGTDPRDILQ